MPESEGLAHTPPQPLFLTTHWSVVLAAKDKSSPGSSEALETLCHTYWYPLYAFVRGSGYSPHDAQDLTQGFFARLLAKDYLRIVDPAKGRFRTFLKMALKRFLVHEWERGRAEKRGGGHVSLSFDTAMAEQRFQTETAQTLGPDQLYDQQWALTLLGEASARLEREYATAGKRVNLHELKPYLTEERGHIPYAKIAAALQTTEGAARVAVHRLRKRFRELFREVIAETVSESAEIEEELRHVIGVLGRFER
jgi:DNA-directed RNA polymerase specialized sigma24 family protein